MALINNISATTELEAVNSMLAAVGSAPITDLAGSQSLLDVKMATERLRAAAREVQSVPWQFNRRYKVPITKAVGSPFFIPDENGVSVAINIFTAPTNLAGFEANLEKHPQNPDLIVAPSESFSPLGTLIFIDRANYGNGGQRRDGLEASQFPVLYIDGWYFYDFEKLPETARRYITVLAARRFIAATLGSQEIEGFSLKDEAQALRLLKRDQGDDTRANMLNHPDVNRVLGGRLRGSWGW